MKLTLICILIFFTHYSFGLGRVVSYEEMKTHLFGSIQSIETCGDWSTNGKVGEFRLVKLYYAGQDMLFVDIVSLNNNGSELNVLKGFTFPEINNDHAEISIKEIKCNATIKNHIIIKALAVNGHNDEEYVFSLFIDGITNTYRYDESSVSQ